MKTDLNTLKFNQVCIIALSAVALATRMPWLIACTAAIMLLGSANPRLALFKHLWTHLVRPALGLKGTLVDDDPRAHNFAQTIGGLVLTGAFLAFLTGATTAGVILTLTVIALALLNLTTSICVGCLMYHQYRLLQYRLGTRT